MRLRRIFDAEPGRLVALALVLVAFASGMLIGARHEREHLDGRARCTHGASSIGPVTIRGGKVLGQTTPNRTGCTP